MSYVDMGLGPVHTKHERQHRVNVVMTLVIQLSLILMKTNKIVLEWGCNPFWSNSILLNESCITCVITALTLLILMLSVNGPFTWRNVLICFIRE